MKNVFWKSYFCIALISCTNLFAGLLVVQPEQIYCTSDGLFIDVDGMLHRVCSIIETENGYFVAEKKYYTCPNCGTQVEEGRFCPVCNFPDDAKRK